MITFEDIMTRGLIYYDSQYSAKCKEFCQIRNISYLPHIGNPNKYYEYEVDGDRLNEKNIPPKQIVQLTDSIFSHHVYKKFKDFGIIFVKQGEVLRGIVHFSDYNRSVVYDYIYLRLNRLERGLIRLIVSYQKYTRKDLKDFLSPKSGIFEKNGTDLNSLLTESDFRAKKENGGDQISLTKILEFAVKHEILFIHDSDLEKIVEIRNLIAHSGFLVEKSNGSEFDYNIESFIRLVKCFASIEIVLKQLLNRFYFLYTEKDHYPISPVISLESFLTD